MRLIDVRADQMCPTPTPRRRSVAKASTTRLTTRLKDLEADVGQPSTIDHAQRMQQKHDILDAGFHSHHHNVVDLTDGDDSLAKEQEMNMTISSPNSRYI